MNLNSSVSDLPFIGPAYQSRLQKLGITKIKDFLYHLPHRYLDFSQTVPIGRIRPDEIITVKGQITFIKNQYTRFGKKIQIGEVADSTGKITVVWFNQPFLVKTLFPDEKIAMAGKVGWFGRKMAMVSPEYEKIKKGKHPLHTGRIIPLYPETYGVSSKWIRARIENIFQQTQPQLKEYLPKKILDGQNLVQLNKALQFVHYHKNLKETELGKKRLAFDELLFLHLNTFKRKIEWQKNKTLLQLKIDQSDLNEFIKFLPFKLTPSQEKSIKEIVSDFKKAYPMNRLLEGDVGSGKTVVAAVAAFIAFTNGYQTVYMAPTQILAHQHYETLSKLFNRFKIRVSLVTSEVIKKELGRNDIFVGTHALLFQKINFDKVALVIIDEQHRFGVEQRASLVKVAGGVKFSPHVLTMTATPIPRTIALSLYGDLDLSTLDELPEGRKIISTWVVPPAKREKAYLWIEKEIKTNKSQAFIVCPLIEESETLTSVKAVKKEFKTLQQIFKNLKLGLLHGRQSATEKEEVLTKFKQAKIDILVSTPVVEVGIDMPNATIMLIEGAERFGLAQLHQLRGRVGRSDKKSYCLLFAETKSVKALARLSALEKGLSGFELAELDLKLRGPGEIFGTLQHGFPELKIASWQDIELIKTAKEVAEKAYRHPIQYKKLFKCCQASPF